MTKLKILLIVIAIISAGTLKAQDYKKYNYYVTMAQLQENNDTAIFYYEKALKYVGTPILGNVISIVQAYTKAGKEKKTIKYFKVLYRHGYTYNEIFENPYTPIKVSDELRAKLKRSKVSKIDFDIDFISQFSEYVGREQFIRKQMQVDTSLQKYMFKADSIDHVLLKIYINEHGYPDDSRIGKYTWITNLLIIHILSNESTKDSWPNYYKPLFLKLAAEGKFSYSFIVSLEDRYNMIWNNCQIYGTDFMARGINQNMTSSEIKKLPKDIGAPIKDIKNLDKRRAEMGLPPYYIYAKLLNIVLPEGYKYTKK